MDAFWYVVSGVFGGGLFTALVFVFAFSNKISTIATNQDNMKDAIGSLKTSLDKHIESPTTMCPMHMELSGKLNTIEANQKNVQSRLGTVEIKVDGMERDIAGIKGGK